MEIRVSCLAGLRKVIPDFNPTHVLSILDPDYAAGFSLPFAAGVDVHGAHFYDDDDLHRQAGTVDAHVAKAVDFMAEVLRAHGRLLLHCHAGASRSPAFAYVAHYLATKSEEGAFERLFVTCNKPWPSANVVGAADRLLGRQGRLLAPLLAYQAAHPRRLAAYQRFNRHRDLFSY